MESKSASKVGAVVLLAGTLFVAFYFYLSHINPNTYRVKVTFDDTLGLQRQSAIQMEGVGVGEVKSVDLDETQHPPRPTVILSIDKKVNIPVGSRFVIHSGILITNPQLLIQPSASVEHLRKDNLAEVRGEQPVGPLEQVSPGLNDSVANVNKLVLTLDKKLVQSTDKINTVLDHAQKLVDLTSQTVASANNVIGDAELKRKLFMTLDNFQSTSNNARLASNDLRVQLKAVVASSRGNVDLLAKKLNDVLDRVDTTIDDANTVVKKLTEQVTDPRFQNSLQETAELARTTLARFNQIAADVHELTGDPNLQTNLKQSVANLQEVTEKGKGVAEKVDTLLGKLTGGKPVGPHLPPIQLLGNISESLDPTRLRVDVDARVGLGRRDLLDVGLYDLGGITRFNLQAGTYLKGGPLPAGQTGDSLIARYGLYASKLGGGLDYDSRSGLGFRLDLWDTNRLRLDAKGLYRVNKNASIWIGADNILRSPIPIVGIQIKD